MQKYTQNICRPGMDCEKIFMNTIHTRFLFNMIHCIHISQGLPSHSKNGPSGMWSRRSNKLITGRWY